MIVGVAGRQGAGKSTLCRLLARKGIAWYQADARAKMLLQGELGTTIQREFMINAQDAAAMRGLVFSANKKREPVLKMIYEAVVADAQIWTKQNPVGVIEAAVLFESGLAELCDFTVGMHRENSQKHQSHAYQMDSEALVQAVDLFCEPTNEADFQRLANHLAAWFTTGTGEPFI